MADRVPLADGREERVLEEVLGVLERDVIAPQEPLDLRADPLQMLFERLEAGCGGREWIVLVHGSGAAWRDGARTANPDFITDSGKLVPSSQNIPS